MVVNDENLILKYHGANKLKVSDNRLKGYNMKYIGFVVQFCGKLGFVEKVTNKGEIIVMISNQEVLFDQFCLMPICKFVFLKQFRKIYRFFLIS